MTTTEIQAVKAASTAAQQGSVLERYILNRAVRELAKVDWKVLNLRTTRADSVTVEYVGDFTEEQLCHRVFNLGGEQHLEFEKNGSHCLVELLIGAGRKLIQDWHTVDPEFDYTLLENQRVAESLGDIIRNQYALRLLGVNVEVKL